MIKRLGNVFRGCRAVFALVLAGFALASPARAEPVQIAAGWAMGGALSSSTSLSSLNSTSSGRLTVQVADLGVPMTIYDRLSVLSFSITKGTDVLESHMGDGVLSLEVSSLENVALNIYALPSQQFKLGVLSWNAFFEETAPVPLPAGIWLMLGGMAWAIGLQRKRAKLASAGSVNALPFQASAAFAR